MAQENKRYLGAIVLVTSECYCMMIFNVSSGNENDSNQHGLVLCSMWTHALRVLAHCNALIGDVYL